MVKTIHRHRIFPSATLVLGVAVAALSGCGGPEEAVSARVTIESTPENGAIVTIAGRSYGETPVTLTDIPAGTTYVQLTKEGYKRTSERIQIPATGEVTLTIALDPLVGQLSLESEPSNASVYLDGIEHIGETPIRNYPVAVGEHTYELRLENHVTTIRDLTVEQDHRYTFTHIMEPMLAQLRVFSRPSGAAIRLNEELQPKTSPDSFLLSPGTYTVSVYTKGYIPAEKTIQLTANGSESIELIMLEGQVPQGMIIIPAGEFTFGVSEAAPDERPERKIFLDTFYIDKFEVTNRGFKEVFGTHSYPEGSDDLPVTGVTWKQAADYAQAIRKRLPTEKEWEKAARGNEGLQYPWGEKFEEAYCNAEASVGSSKLKRIGSFREGVSPFGCMDMAGNAYEWTNDWYGKYEGNTDINTTYGQVFKVLRGGSYLSSSYEVRGPKRHYDKPDNAREDYGFRCAMDVE